MRAADQGSTSLDVWCLLLVPEPMHLKVKPRPWSDVPRRGNAQFALAQLAGMKNPEARKIEPSRVFFALLLPMAPMSEMQY